MGGPAGTTPSTATGMYFVPIVSATGEQEPVEIQFHVPDRAHRNMETPDGYHRVTYAYGGREGRDVLVDDENYEVYTRSTLCNLTTVSRPRVSSSGLFEPTVVPGAQPGVGDPYGAIVRERGFDPAHVEGSMLTLGHPSGRSDLTGSWDAFSAKDDAGRRSLDAAGYHRIETVGRNAAGGEVVEARYLSPEDYTAYRTTRQNYERYAVAESQGRLADLQGPQSQGRRRDANAAITPSMLFTPGRPDPAHPGQTIDEASFDAKEIAPSTRGRAYEDARTLLRSQGLVPHRLQGAPNTYWMTPTQWEAYDRAAVASGGQRVYQD